MLLKACGFNAQFDWVLKTGGGLEQSLVDYV